jgi:uncharacterized protein YbaP (TraB family)
MRVMLICLIVFQCVLRSEASAQQLDPASPVQLETVLVRGEVPAPGLWELTRAGKKVLIMGTLSPVPKDIVWTSAKVERQIAQAEVILSAPGVTIRSDSGFFGSAMLIPAYQKSRKNPGGRQLKDVLPPELYARWARAKAVHLGNDRGVESLRPVYAANELYAAAIRQAGLSTSNIVDPAAARVAKREGIPVRSTDYALILRDAKSTLKRLSAESLDDQDCLVQTLDRLDADLHRMALRANAWANGDVPGLRALPFVDHRKACAAALVNNEVAREQGIDDMERLAFERWIVTLNQALEDYDTVFATLPINRLLDPAGLIVRLKTLGFEVVGPE